MLFASIDRKDFALEMLQRAASLADDDDDKEELYAEIFSDMCVYTNDQKRKLNFSQKALAIYEDLQKNGKTTRIKFFTALKNKFNLSFKKLINMPLILKIIYHDILYHKFSKLQECKKSKDGSFERHTFV